MSLHIEKYLTSKVEEYELWDTDRLFAETILSAAKRLVDLERIMRQHTNAGYDIANHNKGEKDEHEIQRWR